NRMRAVMTNEQRCLFEMSRVRPDAAIGPSEILAPLSAQNAPRLVCLREAFVHRAVAAHFTGRQIAQADAKSKGRVPRDRPTEANLEVAGVRAENQQIEAHGRITRSRQPVGGETEHFVGGIDVAKVMAQEDAAGQIRAGHAVIRRAEREEVSWEVA